MWLSTCKKHTIVYFIRPAQFVDALVGVAEEVGTKKSLKIPKE